ncbi:hypothetical protein KP509_06G068600 [Ceratopteris richardii]|uniref:Lipid droplet-associated hydrolase n=1 Tax=Ceratopteris richardii TaxID=49495 RepID=A0A8T2UH34_CERRI|nr:hypothetical protein KP509_06G068600 [Ceratopteris richardii]
MSNNTATLRAEKVNGYMTEILEISAESPRLKVVFIPGNPGIILFYKSYLEALACSFDGKANILGVGYAGFVPKNLGERKLFSLEEQVEHKIEFVKQQLTDNRTPLVLIGHSIGAYMAFSTYKRLADKVNYAIGLYPFIATNENSSFQAFLRWYLRSQIHTQEFLCATVSHFANLMGKMPQIIPRGFIRNLYGRNWSIFSLDVACQYLLHYSLVRNIMYLGMTEFNKLQKCPDWKFLKERQISISILFGVDDHWGPLTLFEEISKEVPSLDISIEREGHDHAFCCTNEGSRWVAAYCAKAIKRIMPELESVLQL